jgi:hypothetical protein
MKSIIVSAILIAGVSACTPKATEEECKATCGRVAGLNSAERKKALAPDAADPLKAVQTAFAAQAAALQKEKVDAFAALDTERAAKKGNKAKLTKEYDAKKVAKSKEIGEKLAALDKEKATQLAAAKDAADKLAAAEKTAVETETATCNETCKTAGWTKTALECQNGAATAAAFYDCNK